MQDARALQNEDPSAAVERRARTRRRSVRRAVSLECNLESDVWEGSVSLAATDVSHDGLWVETPYALSEGQELVVSFDLPGDVQQGRFWAIAEVARVGLFRRRDEAEQPSGMGLMFLYCREGDHQRLRAALHGRPPPLPLSVRPASVPPPLPVRELPEGESTEEVLPAVLDWLLASE